MNAVLAILTILILFALSVLLVAGLIMGGAWLLGASMPFWKAIGWSAFGLVAVNVVRGFLK